MNKKEVKFQARETRFGVLLILLAMIIVTWMFSPLLSRSLSEEEQTDKEPLENQISDEESYKKKASFMINENFDLAYLNLEVVKLEIQNNKALLSYLVESRDNFVPQHLLMTLSDEYGNEAYQHTGYMIDENSENWATIDIDLLDANTSYLELKSIIISGRQFESLYKVTEGKLIFEEGANEYTLTPMPNDTNGNSLKLTSNQAVAFRDLPRIAYKSGGQIEQLFTEKVISQELILTRLYVDKILGQVDSWTSEENLTKLVSAIKEDKNRLVTKEALKPALAYLKERDYTSIQSEEISSITEFILLADSQVDLSKVEIGLLRDLPQAITNFTLRIPLNK